VYASPPFGVIDTVSLVATGYPLDMKWNRLTSLYGWRLHPIKKICKHHNGIDISKIGITGANIYAYADGVVIFNSHNDSYGYHTIIGHGNYNSSTDTYDYYSLYAHQERQSTYVSVGSKVVTGQIIGNVGNSGLSTGAHLHFEIYEKINGSRVHHDPLNYLSNVQFDNATDYDLNAKLYSNESECLADVR